MRLGSGISVAVVAQIRPLAWELSYATGAALKRQKKKKKEKRKKIQHEYRLFTSSIKLSSLNKVQIYSIVIFFSSRSQKKIRSVHFTFISLSFMFSHIEKQLGFVLE